jgi:hypothetical protein
MVGYSAIFGHTRGTQCLGGEGRPLDVGDVVAATDGAPTAGSDSRPEAI